MASRNGGLRISTSADSNVASIHRRSNIKHRTVHPTPSTNVLPQHLKPQTPKPPNFLEFPVAPFAVACVYSIARFMCQLYAPKVFRHRTGFSHFSKVFSMSLLVA
jgi:hypothetical protein